MADSVTEDVSTKSVLSVEQAVPQLIPPGTERIVPARLMFFTTVIVESVPI
jgi:hypothetical protein